MSNVDKFERLLEEYSRKIKSYALAEYIGVCTSITEDDIKYLKEDLINMYKEESK